MLLHHAIIISACDITCFNEMLLRIFFPINTLMFQILDSQVASSFHVFDNHKVLHRLMRVALNHHIRQKWCLQPYVEFVGL